VYTLSNDATSNEVVAYSRATDGALAPLGVFPTGGLGAGTGLGNQGALAMSTAKKLVFAVNPGDSSLSTFETRDDGSLLLISKVASGGLSPISVTVSGDTVYVLNAGSATSPANISGFQIGAGGLVATAGSTKLLSTAGPGPAQISFTPDGGRLVVSEKATNKIDTYAVANGIAGPAMVQTSAGTTPFGFAFDMAGHLVVSEAAGGAAGASTASSYTLTATGALSPVSSSVSSSQTAACWVAVVGSHAYVANTHSNDLSWYTIGANGALTLAAGSAATTEAAPADLAATAGGDFLYVVDSASATLSSYAIAADGSLTRKSDLVGIPEHATGLVAR
jgi:6-phosphogluconolactonase (cycloisomerase 2 family)